VSNSGTLEEVKTKGDDNGTNHTDRKDIMVMVIGDTVAIYSEPRVL
jgi:hypothetical protein